MSELEAPVAAPEAPAAPPPVEAPVEPVIQERVVERVIEKQVEPETRREKVEREREELRSEMVKVFQKNQKAQEAIDDGKPVPGERERDATGKFKAKEVAPPKEPEGQTLAKGAPDKSDAPELPLEATEQPKAEAVKHEVKAPAHWEKELQDKFSSLDETVAKQIADAGLKDRQVISRLGQQIKDIEPILAQLKTHETAFSKAGLNTTQGIQELMNAHNALERDPTSALRVLAQRYGVDLWNLADGTGQEASTDPHMTQLRSEMDDLRAQLAASQQAQNAQVQTQQEASATQIQRAIDDFAKDRPNFSRLEDLIVAEIHAVKATEPHLSETEVLAKAYEHAELLHPEVRAEKETARLSKLDKDRADTAAKQAETARKAASLNVKSSPDEGNVEKDLRDELRSVWRKIHA